MSKLPVRQKSSAGKLPAGVMPSEHQEQKAVIQWAGWNEANHPELELLHAIPLGGERDVRVAMRLKNEGAKKGVPDLHLPVARNGYHSLYIEMKRLDGGRTDAQQIWWAERLTAEGNLVVTCHGAEKAIEALEAYLGM